MSDRTRRGLSLLEVLIIVGIIAFVIAMLIPAVNRVRYSATRMQCSNNLKQLMLAVHDADSTGRPSVEPPAKKSDEPTVKLFPTGCVGPGESSEERLSWMVALLPNVDERWIADRFDLKAGFTGNTNAARNGVKLFLCPEGSQKLTDATTHYVAMAGIGSDAASRPAKAEGNGFMGYDRATTTASILDGASNTIALMETRSALGPWARGGPSTLRGFDPDDVPWCGDGRPFGGHAGGTQVAMADGSVRFVRAAIDPKLLAAAITIAGGEKGDLD